MADCTMMVRYAIHRGLSDPDIDSVESFHGKVNVVRLALQRLSSSRSCVCIFKTLFSGDFLG